MPYRDATYGRTLEDIKRLPFKSLLERQHAVVLSGFDAVCLADASADAIRRGMDDGVEYVLSAVDLLCEQTGIEIETAEDGACVFHLTEGKGGQ